MDSTTGPHVLIVITFQPNHKRKECHLTYGANTTLQSSSSSIREQQHEIEFTLDPVVAGVTYDYMVSCTVDMELDKQVSEFRFTNKGMFSTGIQLRKLCIAYTVGIVFYFLVGCFLCDLIPNKDVIISLNQLCLEIPNGLVCYNGHLPGAVAVYVCNKEYILHGDSTRECGQDGLWSGQVAQCQFYLNTTSTPTILGTYTLPLVIPLGYK